MSWLRDAYTNGHYIHVGIGVGCLLAGWIAAAIVFFAIAAIYGRPEES